MQTAIVFEEGQWNAYREVNRLFARAVAADVQDGDLIWVHDYHLMLLPAMLREEIGTSRINVRIGFFLHTPFPSSEVYRILPSREELLRGVLHCDLIGFHTLDYARHFKSTCQLLLGLGVTVNGVQFEGRQVNVDAYPIGIDPQKIRDGLERPEVQQRIEELQDKFRGIKLIVGVDRLDHIKGLKQKLTAFEEFLVQHPEWVGKLVLIQVAVPSRQAVRDYVNLQNTINELVGKVNGRFGMCLPHASV